jgi:c-di-GMP-binding flagellar brake protein YcgR
MTKLKPRDKRTSMRFNKAFEVSVTSLEFGEVAGVARNISGGGMAIETPHPMPLGHEVRVRFRIPDSDASIVARAEVKNHYAFNYCNDGYARGMGVKFVEFVEDHEERLMMSLTRFRTLH